MADESGAVREQAAQATGATKPERRLAVVGVASTQASRSTTTVLPTGTKVGRYEIIRLVGEGGMGTVYEAMDARLNRRVALKVLSCHLKSKRKAAKRFAIEAQAAARLVHPNVVGIYDFDMECALPYMAMEFLDGETLASEIARGPLAFDRMAEIMLAVCAGVYAAHQAGIVHRDLKPSNIFLCPDWKGHETARVLDFGISKVGGISSSGLTQTGDILGTSQYLSPEQASGLRHISEASDQYSLGVVMYECMTQRTPQQGLPLHQLLSNVTQGIHAPPRKLRQELPADLEAIIERAMSVRPKDRFRSVHELGRELFDFASADGQQQFGDFYRSAPDSGCSAALRRVRTTPVSGQDLPATLRQPEVPPLAWQARITRTSARRSAQGRSQSPEDAGQELAPAIQPSRRLAYSLAIGAVLAVMTLGVLAFALWQ